jgi:UDP-glucose 4-epimerase
VQKVIMASSWEVYGNVMPSVEDMPCNPITPVGASKLAAEIAGRLYTQIGLDVVILRLFEVWGEGGHSAVETFAAGRREIEGDGTQTRDFVHIDDVVAALCRAYQWDAGIYNLGSGVETAILGLYRLLRTDEPVFIPPRQNLIMRSCADLERVGDLWRAKHLLEGV